MTFYSGRLLTPSRTVLLIIAVTAAVRIALAVIFGLGVDESYMASVSREFAWSYFDHPPLHIWIAGAARALTGSESGVVLRLPFIALFAVSTWLMFRITTLAFGDRAGLWAVIAINLAPALTLSTASWILPEGPLICFALAAALPLTRMMLGKSEPRSSLLLWLAAGVAGGLALLSKYLAIFLFAGAGLFLLTSRAHRRLLASPGPWLALVIVALMFTPVIVWNMQHEWASFAFQGSRAIPKGFTLNVFTQGVGGQVLYLMPIIALTLIYVLARALMRGPADTAHWFFACLAIGPIGVFAVMALWTRVLPHWPMIGWVFAFPLLGDWLARLAPVYPRTLHWLTGLTAAFLIIVISLAGSNATTGWASRVIPDFERNDPTLDLVDWRGLKPALAARGLLRPETPIATLSWMDGGKVSYALGPDATVLCACREPHQFGLSYNASAFARRDAIIIAKATKTDWRDHAGLWFEAVEPLDDVILTRAGSPALTLRVARGVHLKPQH